MSEKKSEQPEIYEHRCYSPDVCPESADKKHSWDGKSINLGDGWSVTCSRCGVPAIVVDMRVAP